LFFVNIFFIFLKKQNTAYPKRCYQTMELIHPRIWILSSSIDPESIQLIIGQVYICPKKYEMIKILLSYNWQLNWRGSCSYTLSGHSTTVDTQVIQVNCHQKTDKIKGDVFESGHAFKVLLICFFFIYLRGKLKRKSASKYTCECEIGWGKKHARPSLHKKNECKRTI